MFPIIKANCDKFASSFETINESRKQLIDPISAYMAGKLRINSEVKLNFICTHNSRRSVFSQVWAAVAADYYNVKRFSSYSGGTEITAVHPNIISSLERHGFKTLASNNGVNPVYEISFTDTFQPLKGFSKLFDDVSSPSANFAAVMVCDSAAQNCPFVPGAEKRFPLSFVDPKRGDGTQEQEKIYDEACHEIAKELFYMFYLATQKV